MRMSAFSSSNRNSASALVSSVLPTPVGPRKMNEPIGRLGPAGRRGRGAPRRDRLDRLGLADDALGELSPPCAGAFPSRLRACGRPARRSSATRPAPCVGGDRLLDHRGLAFSRFDRLELLFDLGDARRSEFARALVFAAALGVGEFVAQLLELFLSFCAIGELFLLRFPAAGQVGRSLLELGDSFSSSSGARASPDRVSFFSASCSILSRMTSRSIVSSSSGLKSTCILSRAAASSIRSIALSGRKRSVM